LLDSVEAVIQYASTMTWKGKHPAVALVTATYQTGVKLTKQAMDALETQLQRLPHLDKWFVDILDQGMGYVLLHSLFAEKHDLRANQSVGPDGYTLLVDLLRQA
jgi:hypothetical protein